MANRNPFLEQSNENKKFGTSAIKDRTQSVFNKTRVNYVLGWTVSANSNSVSIVDASATANSFDVYLVRISDNRGNEAKGLLAASNPAAAVAIDTTLLNKTDCWKLDVFVEVGRGSATNYSYQTNTLEMEGNKNSTSGTINEFWTTGTLNLQVSTTVNGVATQAKTTVADAGTLVLAGTAVGDVVEATVFLQNTSTANPFVITSVAITGAVTAGAGQSGFTPLTLGPSAENEQWKFVITATSAILFSAVVTVLNTSTNVSYVITVQTTAV
jgi:hypothetical protein